MEIQAAKSNEDRKRKKTQLESEFRQILKAFRSLLLPHESALFKQLGSTFNNISKPRFERFFTALDETLVTVWGPGQSLGYQEGESLNTVLNRFFRTAVQCLADNNGVFPCIPASARAPGGPPGCVLPADRWLAFLKATDAIVASGQENPLSDDDASDGEEGTQEMPVWLARFASRKGGKPDAFVTTSTTTPRRNWCLIKIETDLSKCPPGMDADTLAAARAMTYALSRPGSLCELILARWTETLAAEDNNSSRPRAKASAKDEPKPKAALGAKARPGALSHSDLEDDAQRKGTAAARRSKASHPSMTFDSRRNSDLHPDAMPTAPSPVGQKRVRSSFEPVAALTLYPDAPEAPGSPGKVARAASARRPGRLNRQSAHAPEETASASAKPVVQGMKAKSDLLPRVGSETKAHGPVQRSAGPLPLPLPFSFPFPGSAPAPEPPGGPSVPGTLMDIDAIITSLAGDWDDDIFPLSARAAQPPPAPAAPAPPAIVYPSPPVCTPGEADLKAFLAPVAVGRAGPTDGGSLPNSASTLANMRVSFGEGLMDMDTDLGLALGLGSAPFDLGRASFGFDMSRPSFGFDFSYGLRASQGMEFDMGTPTAAAAAVAAEKASVAAPAPAPAPAPAAPAQEDQEVLMPAGDGAEMFSPLAWQQQQNSPMANQPTGPPATTFTFYGT